MNSIEDLKANSKVDIAGCWHWLGAKAQGSPRIWTLDYDKGDKTSVSGPRAVYYIAFGKPLKGKLAYRGCFCVDCVNPVHIRTAHTKAEMGKAIAATGVRKGTALEQRQANAAKGRAAQGIADTPAEIVVQLRAAERGITNRALARQFGMTESAVSRIRLGQTRTRVAA